MKRLLVFVIVLGLGFTFTSHAQDDPLPGVAELEAGVWTTLLPGGNTGCALLTPYQFHVRPANPEKLLIFFNGGGACWLGPTCDPTVQPTYVPLAEMESNDPRLADGIFNFENEDNPFADYSMVFVSYCTGDVHLGNTVATYTVPESETQAAYEIDINHNGYNNAMSALNWAFANYEAPTSIVVTGSSAGAIASPYYAAVVAAQYPEAALFQFGDGAGGYRSEAIPALFEAWGVYSILPEGTTVDAIEDVYVETGLAYPEMIMGQYNTSDDETQYAFLGLLGITETPLLDLLTANFADIEAGLGEDLPTFTAGGELHTILRSPEFYTYAVDGMRFVDWVTALATGETVTDMTCTDCSAPEIIDAE